MIYKINIWIPVEQEEPVIFNNEDDAINEMEHLQLLQPENHYEVVLAKDFVLCPHCNNAVKIT